MKKKRVIVISSVFLGLGFFLGIFLGNSNITFPAFSMEKNKSTLHWTTYAYPDEKFSVKFLSKPQVIEKPIVIGSESMTTAWTAYSSFHEGNEYRVDHFMLPVEYVDITDIQKTLTQNAKIVISFIAPSASSNPRNPRFFTYQEFPAIEYEFVDEGSDMRYKMRSILVWNRLYSVGVGSKNELFPYFDTFVSSMTFLKN